MNNAELKEALFNGKPVIHKPLHGSEIEYKCVYAIVYKNKKGKLQIQAKLLDENGNSISVVDPARVEYKEEHK